MSTPSIAKSRNRKTATSKKRSVQSSATSRRKVTSAATTAKAPPKSDEPKVERVTKQERLLTLLSQAEGTSIEEMMQATDWQQHSVRGFLAGTVTGASLSSSQSYMLATRRRHAAMSRVQESIQKNERQFILDRQSLAHMENSSWRHMDDLHCALEDQEPSHFKRTIRRLKAGIDKLEESNVILRRLNHDA